MTKQEIKYENRLVAFIDILGFKDIVKQSESDTSKIELLFSALNFLKNWETSENWDLKLVEVEVSAQKVGVKSFDIRGKTSCTTFSDSIVVSVRVSDNVNEMASTLIVNLAYIGAVLLQKGILFRGGLTIGNLVHNENGTVFGQGLIDAYMLEHNSAKYPRIILSDKLINLLNYPIDSKQYSYPYHQYLCRFEDGCVGFHQLIFFQVMENWIEMTTEKLKSSLDKIRKVIVKGLDNSFEKPDVFEKFKWLMKQYHDLIIIYDFDIKNKTEENIKIKIRNLHEGIGSGPNIHYSFADEINEKFRNEKRR